MSQEKLSMVVFSGTMDKLYPVAIMASGAVAMGQDVDIFLTFWGLMAFKKGGSGLPMVSRDYAEMEQAMVQTMQEKKVPSWLDTLRTARELGNVRVHACAMTMDLFGLTVGDLEDVVDDIAGVGEFLEQAKGGTTLFI